MKPLEILALWRRFGGIFDQLVVSEIPEAVAAAMAFKELDWSPGSVKEFLELLREALSCLADLADEATDVTLTPKDDEIVKKLLPIIDKTQALIWEIECQFFGEVNPADE